MNDTCFACSSHATTREHVPPVCLFPETKDTDGNQDFRRNLITVPACADHNLAKSGDDEYLLWVLSTNLPANSVARQQVSTKLRRARERRPALGQAILSDTKDVTVVDSHSGTKHDAVEVPLNGARFQRVLDLVALGLYRHHFRKRWPGSIRVHPDFIGYADAGQIVDADTHRLVLFDAAQKLFAPEPKYGENPDVFWYQVHEPKDNYRCLMRLVFYGGCTATAFFGDGSG
jgi:hypothetical protein